MKAVISIHDCMPETMNKIQRILKWLKERNIQPLTLLVVPGKNWTKDHLSLLRHYAQEGHTFAAHGWHHYTRPKKILHRIHSLIISQNVAEHLDIDQKGILELMNQSRQWFIQNELPPPALYVPPAWALGAINKKTLSKTSFRQIEVTRGLIHLSQNKKPQFQPLPLTGYEADSPFRVRFLTKWNQFQHSQARVKSLPLRISIHPNDLDLPIVDQLEQHIKSVERFLNYSDLP